MKTFTVYSASGHQNGQIKAHISQKRGTAYTKTPQALEWCQYTNKAKHGLVEWRIKSKDKHGAFTLKFVRSDDALCTLNPGATLHIG
mgnify:CR=1 FL=1